MRKKKKIMSQSSINNLIKELKKEIDKRECSIDYTKEKDLAIITIESKNEIFFKILGTHLKIFKSYNNKLWHPVEIKNVL